MRLQRSIVVSNEFEREDQIILHPPLRWLSSDHSIVSANLRPLRPRRFGHTTGHEMSRIFCKQLNGQCLIIQNCVPPTVSSPNHRVLDKVE